MKRRASVPVSPEEERALLQARIGLFSKVVACISYGFLVLDLGAALALVPDASLARMVGEEQAIHFAAATTSVVVWLATRRGRLGRAQLVALDAVATLGPMGLYAWLGILAVPYDMRADLIAMLVAMTYVMMRAVAVPSTPLQTALVTLGGVAPVPLVSRVVMRTHFPDAIPMGGPVYAGIWCVVAIALAVVTSWVLYGLRKTAAEAKRLGQYVLEAKLGAGGMGVVYQARHALLRRRTAIKLLHPDKAGGRALARFEREVQMTCSLTHPNTIAIYDFGHTAEGTFYYAMEYLDGVDLQRQVDGGGPFPASRVIHVLEQVCGSLAEAHEVGLVHRDIKPANVVLGPRGGLPDVAKVVDFGLVKATNMDPTKSQETAVVGTPYYMAPEAFMDPKAVDFRVDLYAVGALGHFLLTGSPPFEGSTYVELCLKHVNEPPPSAAVKLGRDVPGDLEAILADCLAKDPADRPASARDLALRLRGCDVPRWSESHLEPDPASMRAPVREAIDSPATMTIDWTERQDAAQ